MKAYKFKFWHYGLLVTLAIGSVVAYNLEFSDKTLFISGETSHGHHQIELACSSCHGDGFSGPEAMQQACVSCHADELELANDSHPRKKFLDPRNAPLLAHLDARQCVTCHAEHKPEITRSMGVTLAGDFCFHCHNDIAEDRSSHKDFAFDSCASAGCHNFHDNSTLYEDFLIAHVGQPELQPNAQLPARTAMQSWLRENPHERSLQLQEADLGEENFPAEIAAAWAQSAHARVAVNCSGCHADGQLQFSSREIVAQCGSCHSEQREAFTRGKHGMRLATQLPEDFAAKTTAMSPQQARLPMHADASGELSCASCHSPHETDLQFAAVEACLGCHSDEHSLAFKESAHFKSWSAGADDGVSCASCHLPRERHGERVVVNHNQNHNLRPNDKMLPVCLNCHGAEFALAALSDRKLIAHNFNRRPAVEHETFDLIRDRIARIANSKSTQ
ncbi:cytochrome c3 family protein [Microbulbifer taiwanensis]|uniref:nitrite reductase (cytochrome; ammonia-forming) n=1 Tax=Microbulbifer taiwanensis TaxID=986746 RepID=A0ABW1YK81_9GAMM|nr:cytochrome c3 family protein [Microbulbifer taiwanensis]